MLVLSRKQNQNIVIDGQIVIKVVRLDKDMVKLGIEAPSTISVHRQEVYEEIERCNRNALQSVSPGVASTGTASHPAAGAS